MQVYFKYIKHIKHNLIILHLKTEIIQRSYNQ